MGVVRRLLLVQGTAIVAACLGLIGAYRSWPKVTLLGALLLFLLSIPMMVSYGPFVFGLAVTLLASSILSQTAVEDSKNRPGKFSASGRGISQASHVDAPPNNPKRRGRPPLDARDPAAPLTFQRRRSCLTLLCLERAPLADHRGGHA